MWIQWIQIRIRIRNTGANANGFPKTDKTPETDTEENGVPEKLDKTRKPET